MIMTNRTNKGNPRLTTCHHSNSAIIIWTIDKTHDEASGLTVDHQDVANHGNETMT